MSNHAALKIDVRTLGSYLRLICEYELYMLLNEKVSAAKVHGKNYMRDRPPLICHLFPDGLSKVCSLLEWSFIISIDTSWDWFQRTYVLITAWKNL